MADLADVAYWVQAWVDSPSETISTSVARSIADYWQISTDKAWALGMG